MRVSQSSITTRISNSATRTICGQVRTRLDVLSPLAIKANEGYLRGCWCGGVVVVVVVGCGLWSPQSQQMLLSAHQNRAEIKCARRVVTLGVLQ